MLRINITKKNSKMLYGLAILMMVYHHLFCVTGRIGGGYIFTIDYLLKTNGIGIKISWFCKICVALFALISGYGSASTCVYDKNVRIKQRIKSDYSYAWKHIFHLMKKYWLVFVVFIPYGLLTEKVEFGNIKIFILNLFGLKATYNSEWWYVRQYIFMMLMFPIINVILDKIMVFSSKMKRLIFCCLIILITAVGLGYWIGNDFFVIPFL